MAAGPRGGSATGAERGAGSAARAGRATETAASAPAAARVRSAVKARGRCHGARPPPRAAPAETGYACRVHVFGLTGGLASGKSSVAARFRERGVTVIDADALAREIVTPASEGLRAITAEFGTAVLAADGSLDRSALGARVFGDKDARRRLEALLHPRIHDLMVARTAELAARGEPLACYEAPLLVEVGHADELRPLVVVSALPSEQIRRAAARDGRGEDDARARLGAQLPLREKVAAADIVIDNTGTRAELVQRADEALDEVLSRVGIPADRYPRPA